MRGWRDGGSAIQQECGKRLSSCESSRHLTARRGVDLSLVQIAPSVYRCTCHSAQTIRLPKIWSVLYGWESPQLETQTNSRTSRGFVRGRALRAAENPGSDSGTSQ